MTPAAFGRWTPQASKAAWYVRRARKMTLSELGWRLRDRMRQDYWSRFQVRPGSQGEAAGAKLVMRGPHLGRQRPLFGATLSADALARIPPAARTALISAADEIVAGRWEALGSVRKDMADPDWFLDPVTGTSAPGRDYCFGIDYRSAEMTANVKQIWELSRMQFDTVLAAAFALTGDARYAQLVERHLRSWWRQNPFLSGIHWTSGIELGLRLISWVWVRRFLDGWEGAAGLFDNNQEALEQIWWHQRYLASFTSHGSSANNHAIAEAAGQLIGALAFDWFEESPRWASQASARLERELAANTFPGGVNREMASEYHGFVLELGLVAAVEADRAGRPLSAGTWQLLCRMMDAAAAVVDATLRPPRQGDGDDARVLLPGWRNDRGWEGLLATGKSLFGAPSWWPPCEADAKSILMSSLAGEHPPTERPASRPYHFPDAGLAILRSDDQSGKEIWCRCDAGPHGYQSIAAHAHADALALEVRLGGVDILADPGTYCYHGEAAWRRYFRSTLAHNTLEIGGTDQSASGGPFLWSRHAKTRLRHLTVDADGLTVWSAQHNGYSTLHPPASHRRTVTFAPSYRKIQIVDQVMSAGRHRVRVAFHLGPEVSVQLERDIATLCWQGTAGAPERASLELPGSLDWQMFRGQSDPVLGWYSARFGEKEPTTVLVGDAVCEQNAIFETILQFST